MIFLLCLAAAGGGFSGLDMNLGDLSRLSDAETRSISAENPAGAKGGGGMAQVSSSESAARDLGQGWKVSPAVHVAPRSTFTVAEITGPGAIQQIRIAASPLAQARLLILRFYWDDETEPSVEVPVSDFFACGWGVYCPINSLPVCVSPGSAFNCYWSMPFRRKARMTVENLADAPIRFTYQVNYTLTDVPSDQGYFHAQFRRVHRVPYRTDYTILDGVLGRGQYVGTYLAWEAHTARWWGEGEIKFFLDGDGRFPTVCGTGTEDYFGGSYNFENPKTHRYETFSTPYSGLAQVLPPDRIYISGQRFGLYRWHIMDPIRFRRDLRVTIQDLGWQAGRRFLPLQDDIASVAYWYQTEPHAKFPRLPGRDELLVQPQVLEVPEAPR